MTRLPLTVIHNAEFIINAVSNKHYKIMKDMRNGNSTVGATIILGDEQLKELLKYYDKHHINYLVTSTNLGYSCENSAVYEDIVLYTNIMRF